MREMMAFRDLMGSRDFWSKSETTHEKAIKGLGFVYVNAELLPGDENFLVSAIDEYAHRKAVLTLHPSDFPDALAQARAALAGAKE